MARLPSARFALKEDVEDLASDGDIAQAHQMRTRSYPHERGQWTTHLFLEVPEEATEFNCLLPNYPGLNAVEEPHVSLTRGHFALRHHQISSFVTTIRSRVKAIYPFGVCLNEMRILENEERTRCFVSLCEKNSSTPSLGLVTNAVDQVLREFGCSLEESSKYAEKEQLLIHSSLFWCHPQHRSIADQLSRDIQDIFRGEPVIMEVTQIKAKIGNQSYTFPLKSIS